MKVVLASDEGEPLGQSTCQISTSSSLLSVTSTLIVVSAVDFVGWSRATHAHRVWAFFFYPKNIVFVFLVCLLVLSLGGSRVLFFFRQGLFVGIAIINFADCEKERAGES